MSSSATAALSLLTFLSVGCGLAAPTDQSVKAFLLAGQSNMEGHGRVDADPSANGGRGSLEWLTVNSETAPRFQHLIDEAGQWVTRPDVQVSYLNRTGDLAPGFGVREGFIGPELGFGYVVGDAFEEPVLLIKIGWGGTRDYFRPEADSPSAQAYHWNNNAETYYLIGDAMGKAMLQLLQANY